MKFILFCQNFNAILGRNIFWFKWKTLERFIDFTYLSGLFYTIAGYGYAWNVHRMFITYVHRT